MINKVSFQDAVEKALDWLTSGQPVNHVLIDDQDDDEEKDIGKSISSSAIEQTFFMKETFLPSTLI
jgi:hypothetical protein